MVLTHGDYDDVGGLSSVFENLSVGEMWEGRPAWDRPAYRRIRALARERGIMDEEMTAAHYRTVGSFDFLPIQNFHIYALAEEP